MSLVLGWAAVDELHAEWDACLAALAAAPDRETTARALAALIEHSQRHFAAEEGWMRAAAFPAIGCHEREHAEVLAVVREVERRFAEGDDAIAPRLAAELPLWFEHHARSMDAGFVAHLQAGVSAAA